MDYPININHFVPILSAAWKHERPTLLSANLSGIKFGLRNNSPAFQLSKYSQSSIDRLSVKQSNSIKRSLFKFPKFVSHIYCIFDHHLAVSWRGHCLDVLFTVIHLVTMLDLLINRRTVSLAVRRWTKSVTYFTKLNYATQKLQTTTTYFSLHVK